MEAAARAPTTGVRRSLESLVPVPPLSVTLSVSCVMYRHLIRSTLPPPSSTKAAWCDSFRFKCSRRRGSSALAAIVVVVVVVVVFLVGDWSSGGRLQSDGFFLPTASLPHACHSRSSSGQARRIQYFLLKGERERLTHVKAASSFISLSFRLVSSQLISSRCSVCRWRWPCWVIAWRVLPMAQNRARELSI